jgi:hypothetical protein
MSHHLDTPLAAKTGQLFIDDLYVFPGGNGPVANSTVLILDINSDVNGLHTEPGFHPEARYEIKIHLDGAEYEELTYRLSFGAPDAAGRQAVQLYLLTGDEARGDDGTGIQLLEGRTGETITDGGYRLWAGHAKDSFYVDLSLLGIVNGAVADGTAVDLSGWHPDQAKNSFAGSTIRTIVLEVPLDDDVWRAGNLIGVWAATKLATDAGGWRQINRAGHPMMWPIFWPNDIEFTDPSNTRHPAEDFEAEGEHIAAQVAAVVAASGTVADPESYGKAVARALLPDILPYVVGTPATFGFAERNGRPLADNAPEAMMSLVAGTAVPSGLKPSAAKDVRTSNFPYLTQA